MRARWASVDCAAAAAGVPDEVEFSHCVRIEACLLASKTGRVAWGGEVRGWIVEGVMGEFERRDWELRRGRGVEEVPWGGGLRVFCRRAREELERV
jgi:hypothetical protein